MREKERYENGEVALEIRRGDVCQYLLEVGPAYVLLRDQEWADLRELLEAFWAEVDDG